MPILGYILNSANVPVAIASWLNASISTNTTDGIPLGLTTGGEVAVKVNQVGSGGTGTNASRVQGSDTVTGAAVGDPVQIGGSDQAGNVIRGTFTSVGAINSAQVPTGLYSQVTITRPANVTAYTANDVVGGAIAISNIGVASTGCILTNLALMPQISAIPAGMTSFRLYLYNVTPPSALADNAPWDLPAGDRASFLGYIDLGSPADLGATLFCQAPQVNLQTKLSASTSLFGYLVTNGGFTPAANSEVYRLDVNSLPV